MTWALVCWLIVGVFGILVIAIIFSAIRVSGAADDAAAEMLAEMERLDYYENMPDTSERLHVLFGDADDKAAVFNN